MRKDVFRSSPILGSKSNEYVCDGFLRRDANSTDENNIVLNSDKMDQNKLLEQTSASKKV